MILIGIFSTSANEYTVPHISQKTCVGVCYDYINFNELFNIGKCYFICPNNIYVGRFIYSCDKKIFLNNISLNYGKCYLGFDEDH
jgi:hypothetical protein